MLKKKLVRTALKYKAQFISMILMVTIGVGIFFGFNVEWFSIHENFYAFVEETGFADYRILSETGFTEADLRLVEDIEGVDGATRYLSVNVDLDAKNETTYEDGQKKLGMIVVDQYGTDSFAMHLSEGEAYDANADGIWLYDTFAEHNDIKIGDRITVSYQAKKLELKVLGLMKTAEYTIAVADENQLMPDFDNFGYFVISPKAFKEMVGFEFYPEIHINSDTDKDTMLSRIDESFGITMMTLTKDEIVSYKETNSEITEGKTMAGILPELFLAIAILTMISTMNRLTTNEKLQIGTLKALGFKDRRILFHYTSYGMLIGVIGIIVGVILGYWIAGLVISPNGMMGTYLDMPTWNMYAPAFTWPVLVAIFAFLTAISFLSVKKMLVGNAADALRPVVPKKVKKSWVEKTPIWKKMKFGARWNFRDVLRHKSRSAMSLLGVMGCTILIIASLGMRDTMNEFTTTMKNDICNYETKINFKEEIKNETAREYQKQYAGDLEASSMVKVDGKTIALNTYDCKENAICFVEEDGSKFTLQDGGVYVCIRLKDAGYDIGSELEFSPFGTEDTYKVKVLGYTRSMMSECMAMTENTAKELGLDYHFTSLYVKQADREIEKSEDISGTQTKSGVIGALDTFTQLMNEMIAILVIAALVLGMIVLYNLGTMSYVERYREMATLKVVGFKDRKISGLLVSQNNWLTIVGILLGLPAGYAAYAKLLKELASEYEMNAFISPISYAFTILLTFGVSLLVSFFVARKNKNIDMVEALKGTE